MLKSWADSNFLKTCGLQAVTSFSGNGFHTGPGDVEEKDLEELEELLRYARKQRVIPDPERDILFIVFYLFSFTAHA